MAVRVRVVAQPRRGGVGVGSLIGRFRFGWGDDFGRTGERAREKGEGVGWCGEDGEWSVCGDEGCLLAGDDRRKNCIAADGYKVPHKSHVGYLRVWHPDLTVFQAFRT